MDTVDDVVAFDGTMSLGEATDFVGVGCLLERASATLARQLPVLGELARIGIESVAM